MLHCYWPYFDFMIANIMMIIQQDKMALMFLIVNIFGSLNMQIDAVRFSKSTGVFSFPVRNTVQKLSAKNCKISLLHLCTLLHICRCFFKAETVVDKLVCHPTHIYLSSTTLQFQITRTLQYCPFIFAV